MTIERATFGSGGKLNSRERDLIAEAIRETDWDETPVLDVVKYRSIARSKEPQRPEYEVERHDGDVPDYSAYTDPGRKHTVYRITEDSCDEMGVDPETGEPLGGDPSGESPGAEVGERGIELEQKAATSTHEAGDEEDDDEGDDVAADAATDGDGEE